MGVVCEKCGTQLPEGISRDEQGAYHWVYHLDMRKNPAPMIALLKKFIVCSFAAGLFAGIFACFDGKGLTYAVDAFLGIGVTFGIFFTGLVCTVYIVMILMSGSDFVYEYVMTDSRFAAEGMTALAGERVGCVYSDVRKVTADRRHNQIKVNSLLRHNAVFAQPHQYDFVFDYLAAHCTKARIKK